MNFKRFIEALRAGSANPGLDACCHGGGKGSPPPAPDYTGAAQAQSAGSKDVATLNTWANRPDITTPWGSQTWGSNVSYDPATGQPVTQWSSNISLSPDQQEALNAQQDITMGRSQAAQTLLGQATGAFETPFDWSSLPTAPTEAAQAGNVQDAQNRAYQTMSQMLQPGREQQQAALDTKLANMGLPMGSTANQRANMQLANQWGAQDRQMMGQAMQQGTQDVATQQQMQASQINQQQQLRQAAIAEEAQRRGMSLNELNALLTGQQVNMPQMPNVPGAGQAQGANLLGAAEAAGNYGLGAAQQQLAAAPNWGSMIGTVGMGAGMLAAGMM
jgi:hypothetical protein